MIDLRSYPSDIQGFYSFRSDFINAFKEKILDIETYPAFQNFVLDNVKLNGKRIRFFDIFSHFPFRRVPKEATTRKWCIWFCRIVLSCFDLPSVIYDRIIKDIGDYRARIVNYISEYEKDGIVISNLYLSKRKDLRSMAKYDYLMRCYEELFYLNRFEVDLVEKSIFSFFPDTTKELYWRDWMCMLAKHAQYIVQLDYRFIRHHHSGRLTNSYDEFKVFYEDVDNWIMNNITNDVIKSVFDEVEQGLSLKSMEARVEIIRKARFFMESSSYLEFIYLVTPQVEGLVSDFITSILEKGSSIVKDPISIGDKVALLKNELKSSADDDQSWGIDAGLDYFIYEFPKFRNSIAHGHTPEGDLRSKSICLLFDLQLVLFFANQTDHPIVVLERFLEDGVAEGNIEYFVLVCSVVSQHRKKIISARGEDFYRQIIDKIRESDMDSILDRIIAYLRSLNNIDLPIYMGPTFETFFSMDDDFRSSYSLIHSVAQKGTLRFNTRAEKAVGFIKVHILDKKNPLRVKCDEFFKLYSRIQSFTESNVS